MDIRIAKLQYCHDDTCQLSQELHLLVEHDHTELKRGAAVAISYTWGEFDRKDIVIGHDFQGNPISMNLGNEWNVQELLSRLAMVCLENGEEHGIENAACWIDQLCIPQSGDSLRNALASIPIIFRTLDVVALMPGGMCGCLQEQGDKVNRVGEINPVIEWNRKSLQLLKCANSLGLCSYFDRVWTRQELSYSRCIRLVRTSDEEMPCAKSLADLPHLSDFANRLYITYLLEGYSPERAFGRVLAEGTIFWQKAREALAEYGRIDDGRDLFSDEESRARQVGFLLGERLTKEGREDRQDGERKLHKFLHQVGRLASSSRRATKARDYVSSVWVDCPGYILPKRFTTMCLPSLLEDALRQLEDNHGLSLMASAGLLIGGGSGDGPSRSILWRPTKYLGWKRILGSDQIYEAIFLTHPPIPITTGKEVPLRFLMPPRAALSQIAGGYSKVFSGLDASLVYEAMKPIVLNWPEWILRKVSASYRILLKSLTMHAMANPPETMDYVGRLFLYAGTSQVLPHDNYTIEQYARWEGSPDLDHHQAVYTLVSLALGLDPEQCQGRGLRLMVFLGTPPCIGLTTMELGDGNLATHFLLDSHQGIGSLITISTEAPKAGENVRRFGDLMLEGIRENDSLPARYRLTGIWVPFGFNSSFKPGAIFDAGCQDGLLV